MLEMLLEVFNLKVVNLDVLEQKAVDWLSGTIGANTVWIGLLTRNHGEVRS